MNNKRIAIVKSRAKERRRRLIERYFDVCQVGDKIQFNEHYHKPKMGVHSILAKHQLDGEYYFVIEDKNCKIYLSRIAVKSNEIILIKLSKTSWEYEQNYTFFDYWIKEAKEYIKLRMEDFFEGCNKKYDMIAVRSFSHNEDGVVFYKFISKHKYKGNYYFVVKSKDGDYLVTKVIWFGFAKLIHISEKEQVKDAEIFETWIKEAKKRPVKKKKKNV